MLAYQVPVPGNPDALCLESIPIPPVPADYVLIKVAAAGINRADIVQRQGMYPPPPGESEVIGLEASGVIVESKSSQFAVGDQVCALLAGGGYAQFVAVHAALVLPIPAGISLVDAASLPEVTATVWVNVFMHCHLQPEELLLVHGGSSGIGSFAIQFAKYWGARVAVTAGSASKVAFCQQLGADIAINYREADFATILADQVDVILDMIGGSYFTRNIACLRDYGRMSIIALQGGHSSEINLATMMFKRASVMGSTLRGRAIAGPWGKAAVIQGVREHVWPALESGAVTPTIGQYFPFNQAAKAHTALESGATTGKLVLVME